MTRCNFHFVCFLVLVTPASLLADEDEIRDEAHTLIMKSVGEYIEQDFTIPANYRNGEMDTGTRRIVRQQLFKGHVYWLWVATSYPDCKIELDVLDKNGLDVVIEQEEAERITGVRVNPAQTGAYYVVITITSDTPQTVDWALVYGYR